MICAACGEDYRASEDRCGSCGEDPLLAGRYRLEASAGRGGSGTLFRATALADGRAVAIKEVPLRGLKDAKAVELSEREARVLRQLDHPGIPSYREHLVLGAGRHRALYLMQDFVEGVSLADELERRRYTEDEVLAVLAEALEILAYLHGLAPPVIHRDVKPANLMRRASDGRLVLVDFGSVRDLVRGTVGGGSTVAGTFGFMAPEQFMGEATPATDIYGLGVTAVALLSRRDPASLMGYDRRFQWRDYVELSPPVEALLADMLANDPAHRPADAAALRARILRPAPAPSDVMYLPTLNAPPDPADEVVQQVMYRPRPDPADEVVQQVMSRRPSSRHEAPRHPAARGHQPPASRPRQVKTMALAAGLLLMLIAALGVRLVNDSASQPPDIPPPEAAEQATPITAPVTPGGSR